MATNNSLLHPSLSYQIIGACFDAFNEIGPGHKEEFYQRAMAVGLKKRGLAFDEQVNGRILYEG